MGGKAVGIRRTVPGSSKGKTSVFGADNPRSSRGPGVVLKLVEQILYRFMLALMVGAGVFGIYIVARMIQGVWQ